MLDSNTAGSMPKQSSFNKIVSFAWVKKSMVVEVICFLFILLFVYAAVSKLIDYQKFKAQIGQSPILTPWTNLVVWTIPSIEVIISIMLAVPRLRLIGLYASFSLMAMFTAYIITITKFSEFIPCSCGGVLQGMTWNQHLIFNIGFTLLGFMGILLESKKIHNSKINEANILLH